MVRLSVRAARNKGTGQRFLLYRGKSRLNGQAIRVILTPHSSNRKTGDMPQVWILNDATDAVDAARQGMDTAVCGDCPLRSRASGGNGKCYVNLGHGPRAVWHAADYVDCTSGKGPAWEDMLHAIGDRIVRLGAYGDPAAVPVHIWKRLRRHVRTVGYTHAWRGLRPAVWSFLMASVDTHAEALDARRRGWRTFRTLWADRADLERTPQQGAEVECPAWRGITCAACGLCCGNDRPGKSSITIKVHGYAVTRAESTFD